MAPISFAPTARTLEVPGARLYVFLLLGYYLLGLPQLAFRLFPLRDLLLKIAVRDGQFIASLSKIRKCPARRRSWIRFAGPKQHYSE